LFLYGYIIRGPNNATALILNFFLMRHSREYKMSISKIHVPLVDKGALSRNDKTLITNLLSVKNLWDELVCNDCIELLFYA
jgi:hypothetical protein